MSWTGVQRLLVAAYGSATRFSSRSRARSKRPRSGANFHKGTRDPVPFIF